MAPGGASARIPPCRRQRRRRADATLTHTRTPALSRYATHLARRLLCVAAGRDVLPPKRQRGRGDGQELLANKDGKGGKAKGGLGCSVAGSAAPTTASSA
jgi:hypothetical protein